MVQASAEAAVILTTFKRST